MMDQALLERIFTQEYLDTLLPPDISDRFFDALYGDASEGAYDIRLEFISAHKKRVVLAFNLIQRPGKCLVCSITYGLPMVFSRHPLINMNEMINKMKDSGINVKRWRLGDTEENSSSLHLIPFYLDLE